MSYVNIVLGVAYHLFGTKSLSKVMLGYCCLKTVHGNFISMGSIFIKDYKISAIRRPSCLGLYLVTVILVCYKIIIQVYLDTFNQFKAHAIYHSKLTTNCYLLRIQTTTGCQYDKPFLFWWPPTEYTMCTDLQRVCPLACMMYIVSYFSTNFL